MRAALLDFDGLVRANSARFLRARGRQAVLRSPQAYLFATGRNVDQTVDEGTAHNPRTPNNRLITPHVEYGSTW